jgi:anti-sigma factor RsiW
MADCSTTVLVVLLLDWAGRCRACSSPARDACAATGVSWQRLRGGAGPLAARLDDGGAEAEEAARARRRELRRKRQQRKARRLQESFKVYACICPSQAGTSLPANANERGQSLTMGLGFAPHVGFLVLGSMTRGQANVEVMTAMEVVPR